MDKSCKKRIGIRIWMIPMDPTINFGRGIQRIISEKEKDEKDHDRKYRRGQRIKKIVLDIIEHYTKYIAPNGYKAMIVASSREAAVVYKRELDRLHAPPSKIVMDQKIGDTGKDKKTWDEFVSCEPPSSCIMYNSI